MGTKEGAKKATKTNKKKYGKDFYARIGAMGGKNGGGHAFAHGKVDPSVAGSKGGKSSKRTKPVDYIPEPPKRRFLFWSF